MTPRHDLPKIPKRGGGAKAASLAILARAGRRRPKDQPPGGAPCPVEPNRPLDLSGGAAAALAFDD